jgi:serine phosphatase RsbU (regulator of sigma subunit)
MQKYFSFSTIRTQILFAFFGFLILSGGFILLTDYYFEKKEQKLESILKNLESNDFQQQSVKRLEYVFLTDEIHNESYFKNNQSNVLEERKKAINKIKQNFIELQTIKTLKKADEQIKNLTKNFQEYEKIWENWVNLIYQKGFKDEGLEGEMRNYIHNIEDKNLDKVAILTIRRHEKDFMLRKQTIYLKKWQEAVNLLKQNTQEYNVKILIENYEKIFLQYATIEQKIGLNDKEGLKAQLFAKGKQIESIRNQLNTIIYNEVNTLKYQNEWIKLSVFFIGLLVFLSIAFYMTRILSKPISSLSKAVHSLVESDLTQAPQISYTQASHEIGQLSQDVVFLVNKVQESMNEIRDKSTKVAEKHRILMESVQYAQRIQQAILPDHQIMRSFKNYLLFYKPRFTVSGDFYWFSSIENQQFVAVVDCTGEGISGAFMSLIGYSLLNKIINEKRIFQPAKILETLHQELRKALGQDRRKNHDSMEICLCRIENDENNSKQQKITFAGANRPLYYADGWQIRTLDGDKKIIGGTEQPESISFQERHLLLNKGNSIYLTTNGYINQKNKKKMPFGEDNFIELLRTTVHLPVSTQYQILENSILEYTEDKQLQDDLTVLALKL